MTWDGEGRDPWLPQRLEARLEIATVERSIREAVWAALSDWLVQLSRRILRTGQRPDMDGVWAMVPLWREAVDLILAGEITKAMTVAYQRVLGRDVDLENRGFATRYLAEVRNRLVRISEEVYDLVAGEVAKGVNSGDSIPQLAARIDQVLSATASERWPNRATVIARTEAVGAMNAGRIDAFRIVAEDEPDEEFETLWLATDDRRTRPTHREADGQRVPIGTPFSVGGFELAFPGDPTGPPQEVIQCRCVSLLVLAGEDVDMSNRQMRRR